MPAQNTYKTTGPIVRTAGATATVVGDLTTQPSRAYLVIARIVALDEALAQAAGYIRTGTYLVDASGVVTLVGSVGTPYTAETNAAWEATLDISNARTGAAAGTGPYVRALITGEASHNVIWRVDFDIVEVVLGAQSSGG